MKMLQMKESKHGYLKLDKIDPSTKNLTFCCLQKFPFNGLVCKNTKVSKCTLRRLQSAPTVVSIKRAYFFNRYLANSVGRERFKNSEIMIPPPSPPLFRLSFCV